MSKTSLEQVKEFHEVFGHPVSDVVNVKNEKLNDLRVGLLREEVGELATWLKLAQLPTHFWVELLLGKGAEGPRPVAERLQYICKKEVFDALCDIQVVLDGAFLALGYHKVKDEGVAEVHRSNMSKLGEDGKPIYREDGKILKGPNFKEPDFDAILKKIL